MSEKRLPGECPVEVLFYIRLVRGISVTQARICPGDLKAELTVPKSLPVTIIHPLTQRFPNPFMQQLHQHILPQLSAASHEPHQFSKSQESLHDFTDSFNPENREKSTRIRNLSSKSFPLCRKDRAYVQNVIVSFQSFPYVPHVTRLRPTAHWTPLQVSGLPKSGGGWMEPVCAELGGDDGFAWGW